MTDALLYEPIPYRSALKENCTHVIALRTRGSIRHDSLLTVFHSSMDDKYTHFECIHQD